MNEEEGMMGRAAKARRAGGCWKEHRRGPREHVTPGGAQVGLRHDGR